MQDSQAKNILLTASIILFLAIAFGAFGAHALQKIIGEKELQVFETGVRYQFYHGLALLMFGILKELRPNLKVKSLAVLFLIGIVIFSGGCELYAVTGWKFFGMIVPIGGTCFLLGWIRAALLFSRRS